MKSKFCIVAPVALLIAFTSVSAYAAAGAVYTESNSGNANSIDVFSRFEDGRLVMSGVFPTGGTGTGIGLGSQGALAIDDENRLLFAVNAGSNSISVFAVTENGLKLLEVDSSNGKQPVSLTVKHDILYVLNEGGGVGDSDTVAGFAVSEQGHLTPIVSGLHLSGPSVSPPQISFNTEGDLLLVTEKATNSIDVFSVDQNGVASGPTVWPSAGQTPFGFAFGKRGQVFVSDAFGGAQNAGAMSSYRVSRTGMLQTVSAAIPDHESAPCWVVLSSDGRYAYTTNTGSGSVSSYATTFTGGLRLMDAVAANTGPSSSPVDAAISNDSRFLYVLTPGTGAIQGFVVYIDGSLNPLTKVSRIPSSASGLVAR